MLIAMTKVVLKVVALVFQRIERLIFDFPPRSPAPHELIDGAFMDAKVGDPAEMLDLVLVSLPALDEVDPQLGIGCIEGHVTDKAKAMVDTCFLVVTIVVGDLPGLLSRRHLLE